MRHGDGGKGDDTRPEGTPGAYGRGYEGVDWTARAREQAALDLMLTGRGVLHIDPDARVPSNQCNAVDPRAMYLQELRDGQKDTLP